MTKLLQIYYASPFLFQTRFPRNRSLLFDVIIIMTIIKMVTTTASTLTIAEKYKI